MNAYLLVKTLHVISSVVLVGTGFGTAFYLFFANRSGNLPAIVEVSRLVVRADTWFTTPAVIVQPLTGLWLMQQAGWTFGTGWILVSIALFVFTGACWLPVVWLQIRLRDMARDAWAGGRPLPPRYWRYARIWEALGYPAFVAMLGVFYLMVAKPVLM
ncbi:DUF2269 domain-containing protein [Pseudothauera nasutitermitis]|uniref:DUF2269 domain-containing protein n=1 Tax=Pseudothauera nasutitermitis TaxID=2565930 RepID=A0A4V3WAY6_9RHOO|nr:DUF2269 domain-containing protein [Pseudothauera nasutitermitis]THF61130.1 DUF2269 domain-containing protein [Pseudothauera nasutitermitis]